MAAKTNHGSGSSQKYEHLIDNNDTSECREIPETFRAYDSFPAGVQCDTDTADMPDDENEFGWTDHYTDESRERTNPDVTEDVIETLLTEGVCREAPGTRWDNRFLVQCEIDGYEWTLVVADDGNDSRDRWVLITIYSNYHGSVGTTNRYFDRLRSRRGDDE